MNVPQQTIVDSETTHLSAIDREHNPQTTHFIAPFHNPETRTKLNHTQKRVQGETHGFLLYVWSKPGLSP
jgi:hypothetical protein